MANTTFIEASYQILKDKRTPLTAKEITEIAIERNLIKTSGRTPVATMGARIYIDIKRNGDNSLFIKLGRGKFGLREWQQLQQEQKILRKGSFKDAAYQVLKQENRPLSIQEITEIAKRRFLVSSAGKTPEATMGAQLYTDIKKFGNKSAFVQLGKNRFGLRERDISALKNGIESQEKETITINLS